MPAVEVAIAQHAGDGRETLETGPPAARDGRKVDKEADVRELFCVNARTRVGVSARHEEEVMLQPVCERSGAPDEGRQMWSVPVVPDTDRTVYEEPGDAAAIVVDDGTKLLKVCNGETPLNEHLEQRLRLWSVVCGPEY